jgi:hypothetical protein
LQERSPQENGDVNRNALHTLDAVDEGIRRSDQAKTEDAVRATLRGWGAELDTRQKFWWMDWKRVTEDVVEATRTGAAVVYEDDEAEPRASFDDAADSPIRDLLITLNSVFERRQVGRWLLAPSRALGGRRPLEALARGDVDAVRRAAEVSVGLSDRGALQP